MDIIFASYKHFIEKNMSCHLKKKQLSEQESSLSNMKEKGGHFWECSFFSFLFLAPIIPQGVCKNIKPLYQCISYYSGWVILLIIPLSMVSGLLAIVELLQVPSRVWTRTGGWSLEGLQKPPAYGEGRTALLVWLFLPLKVLIPHLKF